MDATREFARFYRAYVRAYTEMMVTPLSMAQLRAMIELLIHSAYTISQMQKARRRTGLSA